MRELRSLQMREFEWTQTELPALHQKLGWS